MNSIRLRKRTVILIAICACFVTFGALATNSRAEIQIENASDFEETRSLTSDSHGNVWFFAAPWGEFDSNLYRVRHGAKPKRVHLAGFRFGKSYPGAIAVGPDRKVWVAVTNRGSHPAYAIHRFAKNGSVSILRRRELYRTRSMAVDSRNTTWFLTVSRNRITYMTRSGRIGFVRFKGAEDAKLLVRGPDGRVWGCTDKSVFKIGRKSRVTSFSTEPILSASLLAGPDGNLWTTGIGSVQRISVTGEVLKIPLAHPFIPIAVPGNYHLAPNRVSMSVFRRSQRSIGFTAGTTVATNLGQYTNFSSGGSVDVDSLTVRESVPSQDGPQWADSVETQFEPQAPLAPLATVDSTGRGWFGFDGGLASVRLSDF